MRKLEPEEYVILVKDGFEYWREEAVKIKFNKF